LIQAPVPHKRRPGWLKLLTAVLFILSLSGWLRLEQSLTRWDSLVEAGIKPGPLYLSITGAAIGLMTLVAGVAVWRRLRTAPRLAMLVLMVWVLWLWVDRLWIASSPTALSNGPFLLGASGIILAGTFYALRRGRDQFR
jgi:hypothetical protein